MISIGKIMSNRPDIAQIKLGQDVVIIYCDGNINHMPLGYFKEVFKKYDINATGKQNKLLLLTT